MHAAIADALLDYNIDNQSSLNDDTGLTEYSGTCDIEIIDIAPYGEDMMVLFRIQPDGKYTYVVRNTMSGFSLSNDEMNMSSYDIFRTIRISYMDSAPDTAVEWEYSEIVQYKNENDKLTEYISTSTSHVNTAVSMK